MKIVILGAGVAGVCCAIALRRMGYDVELYERRGQTTAMGAGVVCWPNGSFVFNELGLLDNIARHSGSPAKMQRLSNRGEDLGALDIAELNARMDYPSYALLRRDLMSVLVSHLDKLDVAIQYHHNAIKLKSVESGKTSVLFEHGQRVEAELIIGAEGRMNSAARAYVCGDNKAVYQGFINWIGVFETDNHVFADGNVRDYWGIGERFGIVPVATNKAYWAGAIAAPELGSNDTTAYRQELLPVFQTWPKPIPEMISETPVSQIGKIYLHDHNPVDVWHKDNVLLIGDAAHASLPTSGQGVCQALEDVWHLAQLMKSGSNEVEKVFSDFTAVRKEKTKAITMAARQFAKSLFNTDAQYCLRRNRESQTSDFKLVGKNMAQGWSSGLPIGALSP